MMAPRWLAETLLVIVLSGVAGSAFAQSCSRDSSLETQWSRLARDRGAQVSDALRRIADLDRRLLALRSYLRNEQSLGERWSWSQAQIEMYRQSAEYQELLGEIEKIRTRFERDNPGYQLYANTDVRSLDLQIQRWNENQGVAKVAAALGRELCTRFDGRPPELTPETLRAALIEWQPPVPAPLAAPGLSLHGRARAIDFQVHRGHTVIAGPEVAKIADTWEAQGWSQKLHAAVMAVSARFKGPLKAPHEPWHYEYQP